MDLNLRFTERGFTRADFVDRYQRRCSIQESSIATERCIWLGCEHETWDAEGRQCGARMHLTPEMAAALIPLLQRFVETGVLNPDLTAE